jgi:hypothetical protein
MKKFAIPAVFAVFAIAAINGAAISATTAPKPTAAVIPAMVMPVTQELPFDRYWSKD